jgi:hypothetical protein
MNKAEMQRLHGQAETHACCPKDWRDVPNLVGDYDLDATILHRENPSLPQRLSLYVKRGERAYGPSSGYRGYRNYGGDS